MYNKHNLSLDYYVTYSFPLGIRGPFVISFPRKIPSKGWGLKLLDCDGAVIQEDTTPGLRKLHQAATMCPVLSCPTFCLWSHQRPVVFKNVRHKRFFELVLGLGRGKSFYQKEDAPGPGAKSTCPPFTSLMHWGVPDLHPKGEVFG